MKTDKNFKLNKTTKRLLATFSDKTARNLFKDAMIQAQVQYETNKKKSASRKEKETTE